MFKKNNFLCKKTKKKIKAIINVFYAGQIWDINEIYKFCNKKNIKIIEDACHAIGTKAIDIIKRFTRLDLVNIQILQLFHFILLKILLQLREAVFLLTTKNYII